MRVRYLSFLSLLVPAFFLLSGCAALRLSKVVRRATGSAGLVRHLAWREGTSQRRRSHH
jgi:hypothetical protein